MIVRRRRDADAAGLSDTFKPCSDVNAVTKNVMRLNNHVADIDSDTESNTSIFRITGCNFLDAGLELHSGPNRFDHTRKLRQEAVPGVLHDAGAANSRRRRRPISLTTCARHGLAALPPWPAIQPRGYYTTGQAAVPNAFLTECPPRLMSVIGTFETCRLH